MNELHPRTGMEVFKSLPEGTRVQLIENMIVMEPAPAYAHQGIAGKLYREIAGFAEKNKLGEVLHAPFDVYLDQENVFQPDILFVAAERLKMIRPNGLYGAPDLVAEILSPATRQYDREEKMQVYERCGVKEYWLIDPDTREARGYQLERSSFKALPFTKSLIHSVLLAAEFHF